MSRSTDNLKLPALELNNGTKVEAGCYPVSFSNIAAVYELTEKGLAVKEDGDVSGMSDLDMLSEAPEHYDVSNKTFSGKVLLEEQGIELVIINNQLVNGAVSNV